jgi:hypothetical protein
VNLRTESQYFITIFFCKSFHLKYRVCALLRTLSLEPSGAKKKKAVEGKRRTSPTLCSFKEISAVTAAG